MGKLKVVSLLSVSLVATSALAQAPSHPNYIGQTKQNFADQYTNNWSFQNPVLYSDVAEDEEFYISRVRPKERFDYSKTQVDPTMTTERKLLWWCPIGIEKWNGMPSYHFDSEVFSMWSYVDIYGNWTAPFVRMPAAFIDVCHKNGVRTSVLASVPWASWVDAGSDHGKNFMALYNGGSEKMLKFLRYYGIDGIGFNSEFDASNEVRDALKTMLSSAFRDREKYNWTSFTNAWYSLMNNGGTHGGTDYLSASNKDWFHYNGNPTSDAYFMNYNWGSNELQTSQSTAESCGRSSYDVYAGMDFQGRDNADWLALRDKRISVGLWGAHNMNMIFENRAERGADDKVKQETYQLISENVFTGSSYNPVNTPVIKNKLAHTSTCKDFHGFSSFITARSVLKADDLAKEPFITYFNLGNGTFFNVNGQREFDGEWYNIGIQDYLPTWRWWWTSNFMGREDSDVPVEGMTAKFTWDDAWFGGSCLSIGGATEKEYLHLFKTKYALKSGDEFTIRYKVLSGSGKMYWAYAAEAEDGDLEEVYTKIADMSMNETWVEKVIKVGVTPSQIRMNNKTLAILGLMFENTSKDFEVLIGEISIKRGQTVTPSTPVLVMNKALGANYKGVDFKLSFKMKDRNGVEPIYNDEVNTWYYKIYYQQTGKEPVMCTATTSWAAYVVGAPLDIEGTQKFKVGVSAVSIDGETESEIAWSSEMDVPALEVIETISIDKSIIKPNEKFTIGFDDPTHEATTWTIKKAEDETIVGTFTEHTFTTQLPEIGIYNLEYLSSEGTIKRDGMIQVSGEEVGSLPEIKDLKVNGSSKVENVETNEEVTYTYLGRNSDGQVSRGLALGEKAFGLNAGQLGFNDQTPFTICFWLYPNMYNHQDQGTQLLNIRRVEKWPASDWGYVWSTIKSNNSCMFSFRKGSVNGGNETNIDNITLAPQQWHHIAFVIDYKGGRQLSMYVNGVLVSTSSVFSDLYAWSDDNVIMVGGQAAFRSGINGTIDEYQLYNKALSDEEVKASMQHQDNPSQNLIGYWDFETDADENGNFKSAGSNKDLVASLIQVTVSGEGKNAYTPVPLNESNFTAGAPFISGSYNVKTIPEWKFNKLATVSSSEGNSTEGTAKVSYSTEGEYTATLTLQNGWGSDTKTFPVVVVTQDSGSGIDDASAAYTEVYPNPFENELYVNFAEEGTYTVQVYSLTGSLVSEHALSAVAGDVVRVSVEAAPGTYLVKILNKDAKTVKTVKVIKK